MTELRTELDPTVTKVFGNTRDVPRSHQLSVTGAREQYLPNIEDVVPNSQPKDSKRTSLEASSTQDLIVEGPNGDIPVRVYLPGKEESYPVLVWLHGGGWVRGSIDSYDIVCQWFAKEVNCSVVSVAYRLAPENPFPAGLKDCVAIVEWISDHPAVTRADPNQIAVGGVSAGGNLAAAIALWADNQNDIEIIYQILGVPITDFDLTTDSHLENIYGENEYKNRSGFGLYREDMEYYWRHYLTEDLDKYNPLAAPLRARDLTTLSPAVVITAGHDPLRDEGFEYANRLQSAGVPTDHFHYPSMPHLVVGASFFRHDIGRTREVFSRIGDGLIKSFTNQKQ